MNKPKLIFVVRWDKDKKKTWSGTTYALFEELNKYFTVEEFQLIESMTTRLKRKVNKSLHANIFREDFQINLLEKADYNFKKQYGDVPQIIFQFGEKPITNNSYNFIFLDLCVKAIYDLKNNNPDFFALTEFGNFSQKDIISRMDEQQKYFNNCSAIFTMGTWLKEYIIETCKVPRNKVFAVGGGINVKNESYVKVNKNRRKFLFVGRNFKRKGGERVVEAFKILRKSYVCDAELYIAGPKENKWKNIDGITFLGDISSEELVKYYNLCDVFCMPSYFEAYGLVFGEALCYGLPCIGRNVYAMPEFIQNGVNGYLIDSDEVDELCQKMRLILQEDTIFKNVSESRAEYIERYSWKNVGEKIYKVINEKAKIDEV